MTKTNHGMMLVTDIADYGRKKFTDSDRSKIRMEFQSNLVELFKESSIDINKGYPQDLGDGILYIFPPDIEKRLIVTDFLPKLRIKILEMNRFYKKLYKIKVRVVISFGEYIIDEPIITKEGIVSKEVNCISYLLNSDFIRSWADTRSHSNPICVLFTDKFYTDIVKEHIPSLMDKFTKNKVITKKKTEEKVWAYDYLEIIEKEKLILDIKSEKGKKIILSELDGRCIYLSTADYSNYLLYKRMHEEVPLKNHIETALLLSDFVIVHCADPYRMKLALDLFYEYKYFIESGELIFLLGKDIDNIKKDYKNYLTRKSKQYLASGFGKDTIKILESRLEDEEYLDRVINLIEMSPIKLHRGFSGTDKFINLIKSDFKMSEKICCYEFSNSKVRRLNLTLYQILHLQEIKEHKKLSNIFASDKKIKKIIEELLGKIDVHSFCRRILLDLIEQDNSIQKSFNNRGLQFNKSIYFNLLETRVNMLHLHINIGDTHNFIEITPERDRYSPYFHQYLMKHLSILTGHAEKNSFGEELVRKIKKSKSWKNFVNYHLSLMSEIFARRLADLPEKIEDHFFKAKKGDKFKDISDLLSKWWR